MDSSERRDESEEGGAAPYILDVLSSVGSVLLVGMLLFAVSGVWPPLVAVESSSMEPNIGKGDMVFVMTEQRFAGEEAQHGIVTAQQADSYEQFGGSGDVIVYRPDGEEGRTPIIHRAMFYVEEDEDWYDRANRAFVGGADSCEELEYCPANHSGFITKGDNEVTNGNYDQASRISGIVRPRWVVGTAEARVPLLGEVRLRWGQAGRSLG